MEEAVVAALIKISAILAGISCLGGCSSSTIKIMRGFVPDYANCKLTSSTVGDLSAAQSACHRGVSGDGLQVLISTTERKLSIGSDTTQRELTSIFLYPADAAGIAGSVRFDAFYSRGSYELTGKTGCVGIFESGDAYIFMDKSKPILNYNLNFTLVSPLGWKQDCHGIYKTSGKIVFK